VAASRNRDNVPRAFVFCISDGKRVCEVGGAEGVVRSKGRRVAKTSAAGEFLRFEGFRIKLTKIISGRSSTSEGNVVWGRPGMRPECRVEESSGAKWPVAQEWENFKKRNQAPFEKAKMHLEKKERRVPGETGLEVGAAGIKYWELMSQFQLHSFRRTGQIAYWGPAPPGGRCLESARGGD